MKRTDTTFRQITETEFCSWLSTAAPGDALEYYRGFLCIDRGIAARTAPNSVIWRTAARAFDLAERGLVHLIQNKLDEGRFSYVAIARPHRHKHPIPFSILMQEKEIRK
ncbi:MAG: hypothetical protein HQL44_09790 [Alphaproteobacteria bacterium]|nr:hypothetical protein [Alphaproteobacteria bacterium]